MRLPPIPSREEVLRYREHVGLNDGPALLSALSAFGRGRASRAQQIMVLQFILSGLGDVFAASDPKYSDRESAYVDGRRSVAQALMALCNIGLSVNGDSTNEEDT